MRVSIWPGATALSDQGRREADVRNAAHVRARDKATHVDHDPAAEQYDDIPPGNLSAAQPIQ
jgi:hypothetical protein